MDKLRLALKYALGMNFAHVLTSGLVVKAILFDVSYASFLICIPVLGYDAYKLFLKSKKPDPIMLDAEVRKELEAIKARLNADTMGKNLQTAPKRYF